MRITPEIIASMTGGVIDGCRDCEITGFAKIEEAKSGDISFIANPKYHSFAATTKASVILVAEDFVKPEGSKATFIRVKDPYSSLAMLLAAFSQVEKKTGIEQPSHISEDAEIGENVYIGAFAYIGKGAKIGNGSQIFPQAYIGDGVTVGKDCIIRPHVTVYEDCEIGDRCILHSGCVIGADGFGFAPDGDEYKKIPQIGRVVLEEDVEIGANTTVDRATMGETRIGKGTKLDNLIQIAHNVTLGKNNVIAAQAGIAGSTHIGDSNRIGGQVGMAGHIKFGSRCEVGAQSGINKGYGDGKRIIGYPATDIETFAKSAVLIRRLPELFRQLSELQNEIKKDKK